MSNEKVEVDGDPLKNEVLKNLSMDELTAMNNAAMMQQMALFQQQQFQMQQQILSQQQQQAGSQSSSSGSPPSFDSSNVLDPQSYEYQALVAAYPQLAQMDAATRQQFIQQYSTAQMQQYLLQQQQLASAAAAAQGNNNNGNNNNNNNNNGQQNTGANADAANNAAAMQAAYIQQLMSPQHAAMIQNQQAYQNILSQIYSHPDAQRQILALQRTHTAQQQQLMTQTDNNPTAAQKQSLLSQQQQQQLQLLQSLAVSLQQSGALAPVVALVCDNDSVSNGSSCHQCKTRRAMSELYFCGSTNVKKGSKLKRKRKRQVCRKKYCCRCLIKFYSELPPQKPPNGMQSEWSCPGCRSICSCAACKRGKSKDELVGPPGMNLFSNVSPEQQQQLVAAMQEQAQFAHLMQAQQANQHFEQHQ